MNEKLDKCKSELKFYVSIASLLRKNKYVKGILRKKNLNYS